jgi:CRP/FNR family transcriptional regulator
MSITDKDICKSCNEICDFKKYLEDVIITENQKAVIQVLYKKKETVVKQGSHSTHLIYVKSGLIKVFTERRNEKNIILKIVPPRNFIGTTQIYSDNYNYTAIALKDSEVCLIPKDLIYSLMQKSNSFAQVVYKSNARYSSLMVNKISSLGTKQMHGRLADVILYLCNQEFKETNVFDYITRKDIAEMSGMSSESAIRLLTEFKNDGLIITDGKRLEINNLELLNRLSEVG